MSNETQNQPIPSNLTEPKVPSIREHYDYQFGNGAYDKLDFKTRMSIINAFHTYGAQMATFYTTPIPMKILFSTP